MKQLHVLIATALFFTALGFLLGHRQLPSQADVHTQTPQIPEASPELATTVSGATAASAAKKPAVNVDATQTTAAIATPASATKKLPDALQEHSKADISDAELTRITNLLSSLKTNEERFTTLSAMFETNAKTPAADANSAINLNEFFRNEKSLEKYIPQEIACHSNLCKVNLPAVDKSDVNQLMENLSGQLRDRKLNASHILLAQDAAHGSTQLYVSLQTDGEEESKQ